MNELTSKQKQVLEYIAAHVRDSGIPPTIREIGSRFSIFPRAVQDHLAALERKGVLKRVKDQARGLIVAGRRMAEDLTRLPLLGSVPAGLPAEAIAETEEFFSVDEAIAKRANFALRVKGDSMYPTLWEGDVILVQFTPTADNGEIVVASVDGDDATVKKLRKTGRETFLEAINPAYAPIKGRLITIVGRVTSLIRPFFKT
jgi:repressor LexA